MRLTLHRARTPPVRDLEVEVVERKGLGHPDSLCDALTEELSQTLARFYLETFGSILHHNVDKALLFGGAAQPAFGGGTVLAPQRLYLVGRAIREFVGVSVPIEELAQQSTTTWLRSHLRHLDPAQHIELHTLVRAGSTDLVELFARESLTVPLANDTSIGVGYAPLTDLESVVLDAEASLQALGARAIMPEIGEDIKVLAVRRGKHVTLTVACAFVGQLIPNMNAYLRAKERVHDHVRDMARTVFGRFVTVDVNSADQPTRNSVYITVTGTSAEAGDDGEAGRGNRANGLITPYRPMTLESAAGKNPVSHVGKLYQIAAQRICETLNAELGAVASAECVLVSRIGHPIDDPQIADVRLELAARVPVERYAKEAEAVVQSELTALRGAWRDLVTPAALPMTVNVTGAL